MKDYRNGGAGKRKRLWNLEAVGDGGAVVGDDGARRRDLLVARHGHAGQSDARQLLVDATGRRRQLLALRDFNPVVRTH